VNTPFSDLRITALQIIGDPLKIYFHKDYPVQPLDGRRVTTHQQVDENLLHLCNERPILKSPDLLSIQTNTKQKPDTTIKIKA